LTVFFLFRHCEAPKRAAARAIAERKKCPQPTPCPWLLVPGPAKSNAASSTAPPKLVSLALTAQAAWVTTREGALLVRAGVSLACPQGTRWVALPTGEQDWRKVWASGPSVWAVAASGLVFARVGISLQRPDGVHWALLSGIYCVCL
jgi:hypothetical protein